jgi:hypothetical protein
MPFDEHVADAICEELANGKSLIRVLRENDAFPAYSTIMKWLKQYPAFAEQYAEARADQGDHDSDKVDDIAEKVLAGKLDPKAARVAIDAHKWAAAHRRPKKYGAKIEIEQSGSIAVTHTLDVSGLSLEELDVLEKAMGKTDV